MQIKRVILSFPQVLAQSSRPPLGLLKPQSPPLQQGHMGELLSTHLLPPSNHLQAHQYLHLQLNLLRCLSLLHLTQAGKLPCNGHHIGPRYPRHRATCCRLFLQPRTSCKRTKWDLERSWKLEVRVISCLKGPEEEGKVSKEEEGFELGQCVSWALMGCRIEAELRSSSAVSGGLCATTFSHPKRVQ